MTPEKFIEKYGKGDHSWYSPSAAARILACPGSLVASADCADKTSAVADQGTKCHEYMEKAFTGATWEELCQYSRDNFTQPWQDNAVMHAMQQINDYLTVNTPESMVLEESYSLSGMNNNGVHGTVDVTMTLPTRRLVIVDYKFGMGNVFPRGNAQLYTYAIMAIQEYLQRGITFDDVEIIICQPRKSDKLRSHTLPVGEVIAWAKEFLIPSVEGVLSEPMISTFNPGESQCHFCRKSRQGCEHQEAKLIEAITNVESTVVSQVQKEVPAKEFKKMKDFEVGNTEISSILQQSAFIRKTLDKFEEIAIERAHAGEDIPGYKPVAKYGNNAWIDEPKAERFLCRQKVKVADRRVVKLVSPAQAKKLLDEEGVKMLAKYFEKPFRGNDIAPLEDVRRSVIVNEPQSILDLF